MGLGEGVIPVSTVDGDTFTVDLKRRARKGAKDQDEAPPGFARSRYCRVLGAFRVDGTDYDLANYAEGLGHRCHELGLR